MEQVEIGDVVSFTLYALGLVSSSLYKNGIAGTASPETMPRKNARETKRGRKIAATEQDVSIAVRALLLTRT